MLAPEQFQLSIRVGIGIEGRRANPARRKDAWNGDACLRSRSGDPHHSRLSPQAGIIFRDITTLLGDARAFRRAVDELVHPWAGSKIDKVAGIEARGFILGGAVAHQLSAGFVPIRKRGKLPHETVGSPTRSNTASTRWRCTATPSARASGSILVDDLIATGGTAEAAVKLLKEIGADVVAAVFVIDLPELGGASRIEALGVPVRTLVEFPGH